jgi:hypothetical protein
VDLRLALESDRATFAHRVGEAGAEVLQRPGEHGFRPGLQAERVQCQIGRQCQQAAEVQVPGRAVAPPVAVVGGRGRPDPGVALRPEPVERLRRHGQREHMGDAAFQLALADQATERRAAAGTHPMPRAVQPHAGQRIDDDRLRHDAIRPAALRPPQLDHAAPWHVDQQQRAIGHRVRLCLRRHALHPHGSALSAQVQRHGRVVGLGDEDRVAPLAGVDPGAGSRVETGAADRRVAGAIAERRVPRAVRGERPQRRVAGRAGVVCRAGCMATASARTQQRRARR